MKQIARWGAGVGASTALALTLIAPAAAQAAAFPVNPGPVVDGEIGRAHV